MRTEAVPGGPGSGGWPSRTGTTGVGTIGRPERLRRNAKEGLLRHVSHPPAGARSRAEALKKLISGDTLMLPFASSSTAHSVLWGVEHDADRPWAAGLAR